MSGPHDHPSGLPAAYDRSPSWPHAARMVWPERVFVQGSNLNEQQAIEARRNRRLGNMVAKDGDRQAGADIIVDRDASTVRLASGRLYIAGDVREVAAAEISGVPMSGETSIGVKLQRSLVTHVEAPEMLGLHPGTEAEGEPGAAREDERIVWAAQGDSQPGEYYAVYLLRDGTVIDQSPPPALTGVIQQIAVYDRDANGNYIVDGCEVVALGKVGSDQIFSISAGTANIQGFKRIREMALRHAEPEAPDLEPIVAEPHTFQGPTGGSATITVSRPPIAAVTSAVVVKRVAQPITRGPVPNGSDALQYSSVVRIESVKQGATTYVAGTDYTLAGDSVSWLPAGAEPASASTYTVTYLYNAAVTPDAITDTTVTVSGGVTNEGVLLSYTSKIPRRDLLCMDVTGRPAYVKGISARSGGIAPIAPSTLLQLAEISNTWTGPPIVDNNGSTSIPYDRLWRYIRALIKVMDNFDRSELERDVMARSPVARAGIFTDTFADDFYRDQGEAQTAATNRGVLQLAIDRVLMQMAGTDIVTLDYTSEVVVQQPLRTSAIKINPYANFTILPSAMTLTPAVDYWYETETEWTSDVTREFAASPTQPPGQTTINETVSRRQEAAATMHRRDVVVKIEGFAAGEILRTLTFDDVDVKPAGVQVADAQGIIETSIMIPAGIPVGTRLVYAEGMGGSYAQTPYHGERTITVLTMRRVTLVARAAPIPTPEPPPPVVVITDPVIPSGPQTGTTRGLPPVSRDPLGQPWILPEPGHVIGIDLWFAEIGNRANGVRVQLAATRDGLPTNEVFAETYINMATVQVNQMVSADLKAPVFLPADRQFCWVVMTGDPDHKVWVSRLGDVDPVTQQRVSSHPYTVAPLCTSVNRIAWTVHQDMALAFRTRWVKFNPTAKVVNLWTGPINQVSDLQIRGTVDIPTDAAKFRYEVVRASGEVIALAPGQNREFADYITETVTVRAVLEGSERISPTLYPGTLILGGKIRQTGDYVTRQFSMGSAVTVRATFAALIPPGASVTVECDAANGNWQALSPAGSQLLELPWTEPSYERAAFSAAKGRVRITLNGGPAARVSIARLRAYPI